MLIFLNNNFKQCLNDDSFDSILKSIQNIIHEDVKYKCGSSLLMRMQRVYSIKVFINKI